MINLGDYPDGTDTSPSDDPRSPFYVEPERDDDELERLEKISRHRELIRLANNLIEGDKETFENFIESIAEAKDERTLKLMASLGRWILAIDDRDPSQAYNYMQHVAHTVHDMFIDYWWDNDAMQAAYEADAIRWYDNGIEPEVE